MHQKRRLSSRSRCIILPHRAPTISISLINTVLCGCLASNCTSPNTKRYLLSSLRNKMLLHACSPRSCRRLHRTRRATSILLLNCASFRIGGLLALHAEAAADLTQLLGRTVLEDFGLLEVVLGQNVLYDYWFDFGAADFACSLLGFHRFFNDNKYSLGSVFVLFNTLKMIILLNSKFMLQN